MSSWNRNCGRCQSLPIFPFLSGFIVMPFLCYYLQVHDCIIAIMGSLSGIEEDLVTAFATRGWHMYFGLLMSGLRWRQRQSFDRVKFDVVAGVAARPPPQY